MTNNSSKSSVLLTLNCTIKLFVCLWFSGLIYFIFLFSTYPSPDQSQSLDAIIVLTGGQKRIEKGLTLLQSNKAERLYISGVDKRVSIEDLLKMNDLQVSPLIGKIELGAQANDTVGNALEVREWLSKNEDVSNIYMVTSHYHMPRAILEMGLANPNITIFPQIVVSDDFQYSDLAILKLIFFEYNKYIITQLKALTT